MRIYELTANEGFNALSLTTRPSPEPGPGMIKVKVHATSLNYRDLIVARGAKSRRAPIVPVSDGAGEIVALGEGVTGFGLGDRVAACFFPTWHDRELSDLHHSKALGGGQDGMLAEEVVLPSSAWVRLPEHLSYEQGATLPCAGVTAWHALFEATRLRPGDTLLVQGTGGVSIFALQLGKAAGARVIVTSSSAAKRERAKALGADHVLDYVADPKWGDAARSWTDGRGVDLVVDVGGPGTFDQSVAALRYGGTMSMLGVLTGTKGEINTYGVFHKTLHVAGIYVGSVAMFHRLTSALAANRIEPIIDRTFGFDEARAAYEYLASGSHFGKVVIRHG
jgi:NADPH:quinone reductase-like Zn-dependent oxidoreductase